MDHYILQISFLLFPFKFQHCNYIVVVFPPVQIAVGGIKSRDYFDRYGDLKRIRRLKFRPINRILVEKFKFPETDASEFLEFLCPLLDFTPENRPTAAECLNHPWLKINRDTDPKTIQTKTNVENKLENNISKLRLR